MTDQERNCGTCRFANRTQQVDANNQPIIGQFVLHCHFGPPTALLVQTAPGVVSQASQFPPVTPDMGCAQHDPGEPGPHLAAV